MIVAGLNVTAIFKSKSTLSRPGGGREFLCVSSSQTRLPCPRYRNGDSDRGASSTAHRESTNGRHAPAARMESSARSAFLLRRINVRASPVWCLACSPRIGPSLRRRWYCLLRPRETNRSETVNCVGKESLIAVRDPPCRQVADNAREMRVAKRTSKINVTVEILGGEGGIRTLGTLTRSTVFETAPFDHSGTSPSGLM